MDVSSIAGSFAQDLSQTTQQRTQEKAELLVQKKAMDIQADAALALMDAAAASAPSSTGGDNVGKNINVSV
ncbi:MAG: hypothetical protein CML06_04055 [Pseudomonadales bacterium]|nr:hypothetical protein [Pseudomonadales bacterium]